MVGVTWKEYRPSELRFTHDSIKTYFYDGHSMEETLRSVLDGQIRVSGLPAMEVMKYRGRNYVVRGNRRLYLYRKLEQHGYVTWIRVKKIPFDDVLFEKMHTTENRGKSVRIRGPMGYRMDSYLDDIIHRHRFGDPQPTPPVRREATHWQQDIFDPAEPPEECEPIEEADSEDVMPVSQRSRRWTIYSLGSALAVGVVLVLGYALMR